MDESLRIRKRLVLISTVGAIAYISILLLMYDESTLAEFQVEQTEIRIMYNRSNNPLLWLSEVGGVTWDAHGPGYHESGRLSGSATYDLPGDVIVEHNTKHPDRFTITKWGSSCTPTEWVVDVSDDKRVTIREYNPDRPSNP